MAFVQKETSDEAVLSVVHDYMTNVLEKQIILFSKNEPDVIKISTKVDLDKLLGPEKIKLENHSGNQSIDYELLLPESAAKFIATNYASPEFVLDEAAIQDIFTQLGQTSKNCLLRNRTHFSNQPVA